MNTWLRTQKRLPSSATIPFLKGRTFVRRRQAKGGSSQLIKNLTWPLLGGSDRLPFLKLEDKEDLDDSTPLRVWSWPGWNKWEKVLAKPLEDALEEMDPDWAKLLDEEALRKAVEQRKELAVMTDSWTEDNPLDSLIGVSLFSFAGHIEFGMSDGPVVSILTNKIIGVIIKVVFHTEGDQEAAERWYRKAPPRV